MNSPMVTPMTTTKKTTSDCNADILNIWDVAPKHLVAIILMYISHMQGKIIFDDLLMYT